MRLFNWLSPFRDIHSGKFTELRADLILHTIGRLEQRIYERFPDSGLGRVCHEFHGLACQAERLAQHLERPVWPLRLVAMLAAGLLIGLATWATAQVVHQFNLTSDGIHDLLQSTESVINELIFLGLALYFFISLEARLKRRSALHALHRLRSIAHVVDMHQLTKDPAHVLAQQDKTASSPQRGLSRYQLTRYLDYCSELLALEAKVAALFAQNTDDEVVLSAVNDLEVLVQGLSAKIWQKIMILDLAEE